MSLWDILFGRKKNTDIPEKTADKLAEMPQSPKEETISISSPEMNKQSDILKEQKSIPECIADDKQKDVLPSDNNIQSDIQQLEMTFQEAQKAGFQFHYCKSRHHKSTVAITGIHIKSDQIIIPAKIDGHIVRIIEKNCRIINCPNATDVKLYLPNTLEFIGERAFSKCDKLTEVFFPEKKRYNRKKLLRLAEKS